MSSVTSDSAPAVAPDGIMQLGLGFWGAKTLLSAVELGLFTELASGPATPRRCRRGSACTRAAPATSSTPWWRWACSSAGRALRQHAGDRPYLDRAKPTYIGGMLEMANARLYGFWGGLTEALRTGQARRTRPGTAATSSRHSTPTRRRLEGFLQAMTGLSAPVAAAIAGQFPWADYRTLVDVGTAQGGLPVTVARAHPHLSGGGFDLPAGRARLRGVRRRARSRRPPALLSPGDFLRDPLPTADVLVMGHILHDWDLERETAAAGQGATRRYRRAAR